MGRWTRVSNTRSSHCCNSTTSYGRNTCHGYNSGDTETHVSSGTSPRGWTCPNTGHQRRHTWHGSSRKGCSMRRGTSTRSTCCNGLNSDSCIASTRRTSARVSAFEIWTYWRESDPLLFSENSTYAASKIAKQVEFPKNHTRTPFWIPLQKRRYCLILPHNAPLKYLKTAGHLCGRGDRIIPPLLAWDNDSPQTRALVSPLLALALVVGHKARSSMARLLARARAVA